MAWKVNMYRGYLAICHPEEQQLSFIERLVEMASSLAIREWRRLPHVVSHVHTPLLQVGAERQGPSQQSPRSRLGALCPVGWGGPSFHLVFPCDLTLSGAKASAGMEGPKGCFPLLLLPGGSRDRRQPRG